MSSYWIQSHTKHKEDNVLRKLAEQHTDAVIILTSTSLDQTEQLQEMGGSLSLKAMFIYL